MEFEIHTYEPYYGDREGEPGRRASYGSFRGLDINVGNKLVPERLAGRVGYVLPGLLSYGDYSNGSLVQRSNHRVFLERFGKVDGVVDLYGGYGTIAVAIRVDLLDTHEEIKDTIEGLDNYGILDEEDHCELEQEATQEAWEDWGRHDFVSHILKNPILGEMFDEESLPRNIRRKVYNLYYKQLRDPVSRLFWDTMEECNEYWQDECGSMICDMDEIAQAAIETILLKVLPRNQLPTLLGLSSRIDRAVEQTLREATA